LNPHFLMRAGRGQKMFTPRKLLRIDFFLQARFFYGRSI
jgi:hypothetical protein